jgi:hypothetical protein
MVPAVPATGEARAGDVPRRRFFIVAVSEDEGGEIRGVVEAVRSGRKEPFAGLDMLGSVVGALFRRARDEDRTGRKR